MFLFSFFLVETNEEIYVQQRWHETDPKSGKHSKMYSRNNIGLFASEGLVSSETVVAYPETPSEETQSVQLSCGQQITESQQCPYYPFKHWNYNQCGQGVLIERKEFKK